MSLSINTNTAAMAALQSLNQTTADLTKTENAVSTGKSVNTASDNPALYSIAQNMTAQISTLSGVSTGLQFSAQVLNTATQGLSSISSALQSLATTIGTNTTGVDNSTLNDAITKTLASIDSAATGAKFQGVNLLSGQTGNGTTYTSLSTAMDSQGTMFTQNGFNVTSAGLGLTNLSMDMSGSSLAVPSASGKNALTDDATAANIGSQSVLQLQNTVAAANSGASATTPSVTYNFVADSHLDGTGTNPTADNSETTALDVTGATMGIGKGILTLDSTTGLLDLKDADVTASVGPPAVTAHTKVTINSYTTASDGSTTYSLSNGDSIVQSKDGNGNSVYTANTAFDANGNVTTKTVTTDVNTSSAANLSSGSSTSAKSVKQMDLMTSAMEYQGFGVSRDATNTLTIAGNSIDATSTKLGSVTSGAFTGTTTATAVTGASVVSAVVQAAISSVTRTASTIGYSSTTISNLQTTTSSLSDALTTGVGALTDADLAAESAKLTSLQTKQQLAVQSLSIANSQSSTLLSLFRG
ncbi:flagellin N-terminal helical domain-containing protein [Gluconobacter oxydans]|uniref:flagellin N-terminal helical domain-containing protein n=1 Tax=Gluconobacter oxydans TaxID=442 RepID=UPI0020A192AA|nr:flagellin [Gluconobacter oxydans]MCP1248181.1 flagellin [Gluconobacter oxydans]